MSRERVEETAVFDADGRRLAVGDHVRRCHERSDLYPGEVGAIREDEIEVTFNEDGETIPVVVDESGYRSCRVRFVLDPAGLHSQLIAVRRFAAEGREDKADDLIDAILSTPPPDTEQGEGEAGECQDALDTVEPLAAKAVEIEHGLRERRFGSIEEIERVLFPKLYAENHPPTEPHPEIEDQP